MHYVFAYASWSSAVGGQYNYVYAPYSAVGGGAYNFLYGYASAVVGGSSNRVYASWTSVGGGNNNGIYYPYGVVGGGAYNSLYSEASVVVGGSNNRVFGDYGSVGGGSQNTVYNDWSSVSGGKNNYVLSPYAVVVGGSYNYVYAYGGLVGGGMYNRAYGNYTSVGGGYANSAVGKYATVGGGDTNTAEGQYAVVAGGSSSVAEGAYSTSVGGQDNYVGGYAAVVVGGDNVRVYASWTSAVGGRYNGIYAPYAVVAGGSYNLVYSYESVVVGGLHHRVYGSHAGICGGINSSLYGDYAFIGGGSFHTAHGEAAVVTGGSHNSANGDYASAGGGADNIVSSYAGVVAGGLGNENYANAGTIVGGHSNYLRLDAFYAFVGGGRQNTAQGNASVVVGGYENGARGQYTSVGGGYTNTARGIAAFIAGGMRNLVNSSWASVIGGRDNSISAHAQSSVVAGGERNFARAPFAVIAGGRNNHATGNWSVVNGGSGNSALGTNSLAQGAGAVAEHNLAAVMAFSSTNGSCRSLGNSTIALCADNGVFVNGESVSTLPELEAVESGLETLAAVLNASVESLRDDAAATQGQVRAQKAALTYVQGNVSLQASQHTEIASIVGGHSHELLHLSGNSSLQQEQLDDLYRAVLSINGSVSSVNAQVQSHAGLLNTSAADIASLQSNDVTLQVQALTTSVATLNASANDLGTQFAELESANNDLESMVVRLNETVSLQTSMLAAKDDAISTLESTVSVQQAELSALRNTVDSMNNSLTSLTLAVEQMMQSTSFVQTTQSVLTENGAATTGQIAATDCVSDGSPCAVHTASQGQLLNATAMLNISTAASTNAVTTLYDVTTSPLPEVTVRACKAYTCEEEVDVFGWTANVVVVAAVDGAATQFDFTLSSSQGDVLWHVNTDTRFASFVPRDLDVSSTDKYYLHVVAELADARSTEATSEALSFAAPPTLHSVAVHLVNSSAAANWFEVVVNATDATDMSFEYWVADTTGLWQYLVATSDSGFATVAVPSTKNVTLQVTVTNTFASAESCTDCPTLLASSLNVSIDEVLQDALQLVSSGTTGSAVLLAALDVVEDGDEGLDVLLDAFSAAMQTNSTALSQDLVVLNALVDSVDTASGVLKLVQDVGSRIEADTSSDSLTLYLDAVDEYSAVAVTQDDALDGVADVDEYLGAVCASDAADGVPDGSVSVFTANSYSLSCASSEDIVAVDAGTATVMAAVDGVSSVAVSTWDSTANMTTNTSLLSTIHGVHVKGGRVDVDAEDVDAAMTLKLSLSGESHAIRKAASCVYYDEATGSWQGRGVVLRGMELDDASVARVICTSSHLTLFTVGDASQAARVVEDKLTSFADRVERMNNVNFLDDGTTLNWNILGVFLGATVLFAIAIVVAKIKGRKAAVDRGRLTFHQTGRLSKPNVMGSTQYEAVLRRWMSGKDTVKLVVFELLTSNAVLGLLFQWDHEAVVFGRADKAVILFGAVLMTFVSSAFLFDPQENVGGDLLVAIWSALVAAVLTNALLLPVQHFLPYMVSNVNSLTTRTRMPTTLLQREMKRRSCWKTAKRRRSAVEVQSQVVMHWLGLLGSRRFAGSTTLPKQSVDDESELRVPTQLHFLHCDVDLPSATAVRKSSATTDWSHRGIEHRKRGIVLLQRQFRAQWAHKRESRDAEFEAWYVGLRRERHVMAMLSASVLLVLAAFTLSICLLLSGTFNDDESLMWAVDVTQSLVVQIFITDPAVTLVVVFGKFFVSWALLRTGKRRLKRQLQDREEAAQEQLAAVAARVEVVKEQTRVLRIVASGSRTAVAQEKAAKKTAKKHCESTLENIALAKATIVQKRQEITRPKRIQLEAWDNQESELNAREKATEALLKSVKAALSLLHGGREESVEQLRAAQKTMEQLQGKLKSITRAKVALSHQMAQVDDKPKQAKRKLAPVATKRSAIVPVVPVARPMVHDEEPGVDRVVMPSLCSAAEATTRDSSSSIHNTPATSRQQRRGGHDSAVPRQRNARERRRRRIKASGATSPAPRRNPMTWAEIRKLQESLKAKAAQSAAKQAVARRRRRRRKPGTLGKLPPGAIEIVLQRRERRRQMLRRRSMRAEEVDEL